MDTSPGSLPGDFAALHSWVLEGGLLLLGLGFREAIAELAAEKHKLATSICRLAHMRFCDILQQIRLRSRRGAKGLPGWPVTRGRRRKGL